MGRIFYRIIFHPINSNELRIRIFRELDEMNDWIVNHIRDTICVNLDIEVF